MTVPLKPTIAIEPDFHFDQVDHNRTATSTLAGQINAPILDAESSNPGAVSTHIKSTINAHIAHNAFELDALHIDGSLFSDDSAPLGDLMGFTNPADKDCGVKFAGVGFNTIFRPQSPKSIAQDPITNPVAVQDSDNILELNLTRETLTFASPLGKVPNRGSGPIQPDIFLNAVPYVQSIQDITFLPPTARYRHARRHANDLHPDGVHSSWRHYQRTGNLLRNPPRPAYLSRRQHQSFFH
jgi:hypothetical protein